MKLFGTDGIRGAVGGKKINPEVANRLGKALVFFCRKRKWPEKIVLVRDTRESGPMLEDALTRGITSTGADAVVAGVLPTPALAYLVRVQGAGAGLVISASHNPADYNGLKPFKGDGMKMTDVEESEIEKYIADADDRTGNETVGKTIYLSDAKDRYIRFILSKLPKELFKVRPFPPDRQAVGIPQGRTLVLDCANGANFEVAPAIFRPIVKELNLLYTSPDGKNINDGCGSQHPEKLRKAVIAKKADLGLAFDGDGDRVIAVDEKGNVLTGDQIIYVIAKMLEEQGKLKNDLVVTTVMSNLGFVAALRKLGINHLATAVGDRAVYFEMMKNGVVLGGEESGHVIYSDYHPAGDGIVGGIMLMAAMNHFKEPLSKLAGEITLYPKLLVNVPVKSKPELGTVPEIANAIKEVEKKLGKEGRVLVRYSGTENLCRVMVEGRDEDEVRQYADAIAKIVKGTLG